jgi:glucokinase
VVVESDVRCGALGELSFGQGREERDFVYVSLGTGLSSAIVLDGRVHVGRRGEAIALGEFTVSAPVGESWQGNLESYASGTGIATRFAAANATEPPQGGARVVVEAAADGDAVAAEILNSAGTAIGSALAQIAFVLDPPLFVLGGGLGVVETSITTAIHSQFESMTQRRPNPPRVRRSSVATNVGLLGAAVAAWQTATV